MPSTPNNTEDIELRDFNSSPTIGVKQGSFSSISTKDSSSHNAAVKDTTTLSTDEDSSAAAAFNFNTFLNNNVNLAELSEKYEPYLHQFQGALTNTGNQMKKAGLPLPAAGGFLGSVLSPSTLVLRPWRGEFFVLSKPSWPVDAKKVGQNLSYFKGNLLVCNIAITGLGLLLTPSALLTLSILAVAWTFFYHKNRNKDWITAIAGREITSVQRTVIMIVLSVVFIFLMIGPLLLMLVGLSLVADVGHAVCHRASRDYSEVLSQETTSLASAADNV